MRYTKPVRFIYSGNVHAAQNLRGQARTLIGKTLKNPVGRELGRKQNMGRFKYNNGVQFTVQRTFGVINCYIHVPKEADRFREYAGLIVYPYMGWMYHARQFRHIYYSPSSADYRAQHLALFSEYSGGYYFNRQYGWEAPYGRVGTNRGTELAEEPAYPRWLIPRPHEKTNPEQAWSYKYITKAGSPSKYRPDSDVESFYVDFQTALGQSTFNTQREHEKWYKTTATWTSSDNKYHTHYEGQPQGDIGYTREAIDTDGIKKVYVNGVEYITPMPCIAAVVKQDVTTGTDWLYCWLYSDLYGEPGDDYITTAQPVVMCRVRDGKQPTLGVVWEPSTFAALTAEEQFDSQYDWTTLSDGLLLSGSEGTYVIGGYGPQITTNKTWYDAYAAPGEVSVKAHERWIPYGSRRVSVNSTATNWVQTWMVDGGTGSQWNEFSIGLTVGRTLFNGDPIYTPTTTMTYITGANATLTTDAIVDSVSYNCGTVVLSTVYDNNDVKAFFTMKLELLGTGTNTDAGEPDTLTKTVTFEFDSNTWVTTAYTNWDVAGTYTYTQTSEVPVYYDIKTQDKVIEKMPTCSVTSYDPAIQTWTYQRDVYIGGVLFSNDSGSSTFAPSEFSVYADRPFLNFGNWKLPLGDPDIPSNWNYHPNAAEWYPRNPAPISTYLPQLVHPRYYALGPNVYADTDTHWPSDTWRPSITAYCKEAEPPGFVVHDLPGGQRMGYYVPRSFSAVTNWLDYTNTTTYENGEDENFRVEPVYFISGPKTVYNILNLSSELDSNSKLMVPIIDVFYYRRSDQSKVNEWRLR